MHCTCHSLPSLIQSLHPRSESQGGLRVEERACLDAGQKLPAALTSMTTASERCSHRLKTRRAGSSDPVQSQRTARNDWSSEPGR
eukprot:1439586-Rhodomonas_salina.1